MNLNVLVGKLTKKSGHDTDRVLLKRVKTETFVAEISVSLMRVTVKEMS